MEDNLKLISQFFKTVIKREAYKSQIVLNLSKYLSGLNFSVCQKFIVQPWFLIPNQTKEENKKQNYAKVMPDS